jgi:hypothetical protein
MDVHIAIGKVTCARAQAGLSWISPVNISNNSSMSGLYPTTNTCVKLLSTSCNTPINDRDSASYED